MSLRDFRPLRYSSQDVHAEGEHVNGGRGTPSVCSTLQVIDMSTLGDATYVNPVIKFLPQTCNVCVAGLTSAASPRLDISITCKVGQKLGVSLPLLPCIPFGVTIPATVPQWSEIPEGHMNYSVFRGMSAPHHFYSSSPSGTYILSIQRFVAYVIEEEPSQIRRKSQINNISGFFDAQHMKKLTIN